MPADRLRVFLSYGRRDAHVLAGRLADALPPLGIDVWRDTAELRAGRAWEQQILAALQDCDVVLALLSPHSTRSIAGGSGDDSVCLDELAAARYGTPARPIVPALAVPGATTPLTVLRLHQLDLTAAAADTPAAGDALAARLPALVQALRDAAAEQTASRAWEDWLAAPPEAGAFLHARHRGFSGRHWLFNQIDHWRTTPGAPALLLRGEPGIGKSAVLAELTIGAHAGATLASHCCQWDVADSLRPAQLLRALARQTALRLPAYAAQLEDGRLRRHFEQADSDPGAALDHGLLGPLADVDPPPGGPWLWCIDALDEALLHRGSATIVDLLASRLDRLPPWLRIVATTRDDPRVRRALGEAQALLLEAGTPDNLDDLRQHVQATLERLRTEGRLQADAAATDALAGAVLARSRGSFLYADFVLRAAARGQLGAGAATGMLPDLPPGLPGVYERELRRALPGDEALAAMRPLLAVLCAAQGPLPAGLLAAAAGLGPHALRQRLRPIQPFLREVDAGGDGPAQVFWHKSVHDFLTGDADADSPFAVDMQQGDALLAALLPPWVAAGAALRPLPQYLRSHGMTHLAGSGRFLADLDDAALDRLLGLLVAGSTGMSVGALPLAWPDFVTLAVQQQRWGDLDRLLATLARQAEQGCEAAGLWTWVTKDDGQRLKQFTGAAREARPLADALLRMLLAVSVLDQARAARGTAPPFARWLGHFGLAAYAVGGLDIAGWRGDLSGYFEDQGMALSSMFTNLRAGRPARDWGRAQEAGRG